MPRRALGHLLPSVLALILLAFPAGAAPEGQGAQQRLERLVQILDYVGVDYAVAVQDGEVVSRPEYREMQDFVARAAELTRTLPEGADRARLLEGLAALGRVIDDKADPALVRARANELEQLVLERFPVRKAPEAAPDMDRGERLFRANCVVCHGAEGRGDGPRAEGMEPPPTNFHNEARVFQRSPFGFFTTITHGLEGTAMNGYGGRLSAAARWDLAFYVAAIPFATDTAAAGKRQFGRNVAKWADRVSGLPALATTPTETLLESGHKARPVVAYLRRNPGAVAERSALPLAVTRNKLEASRTAYAAGNRDKARSLAVSAYLDGFEPLEPRLDAVDHQLRLEVEGALTRFRSLVSEPGNGERVAVLYRRVLDSLERVERRLASGSLSTAVAFVSSLGILLREGVEALLVVGAILTVLVRTGQREGIPYVHAGWITALALGGATWFAARGLIQISGAGREVVEGLSGLIAAAILFYVSYWFVTKVEHRKWQAFIRAKVDSAVSHGALWVLALVVFLAVYREAFETILFYQALWGHAAGGTGNGAAILWGVAAAAVLLVGLGWGIFRAGVRLPLRAFFIASSALLFLLAVVLAGKGMLALQEAGWIDPTPVAFPRLGVLGIYPYAEPLLLQAALVVLMGGSLLVHYRVQQVRARREGVRD